ncbi:MAG: DegT/DnrJ/EryC1/StrS family aminotransferase [Bacteroidales bacterium]|nr:DegT/DnrJ/EryC1/StrS family aminotransferase [Bacteroidales bacterium]
MHNIPFSPPDMTEAEINEVAETLRSGWITTGPRTKKFESLIAQYCGTERAVCLNSATACEELILRVFDIGPGDEVIVPAYTYTASASPICHVGAKLVMVDCAPDTFEMDYERLADAITERTKAIIPVDLGGVVCDYARIRSIVDAKRPLFRPANTLQEALGHILILADGAHAFGAKRDGRMCGSIADFTSFSFHAVKNLTTAEGGALTWLPIPGIDNEWLYKQFQLLSLHGQSKDALAKTQLGAWEYDIVAPNYKCNMTDVMAAIGLVQFKRYPELLKRRQQIINRYNEALGIPSDTEVNAASGVVAGCVHQQDVQVLNHYTAPHSSSGHLYLVRLLGRSMEERNRIINQMAERGIACNVHYKPLPMMTAYKKLGFDIQDFPNAYAQFANEITLPLHTRLSDEDVAYVTDNFVDIMGR